MERIYIQFGHKMTDLDDRGFDNKFKAMVTIFLAQGLHFKEKTEVEPFGHIKVYNLMCDLLHNQPAPNNGTHSNLNHHLKMPFHEPSQAEVSKCSVCGFTVP